MKTTKALTFKVMDPNNNKKEKLNHTIRQNRRCTNFYLHEIAKDPEQIENKNLPTIYEKAKERFDLQTSILQQCGRVAIEKYKSYDNNDNNKQIPHFDSFIEVRMDKRALSLKETDNNFNLWASISTTGGRIHVPIRGGNYQFNQLKETDFNFEDARLFIKDKEFYLTFHIKMDVDIPNENNFEHFVGIDLGVNNLATVVVQNRKGDILESKFFDGSYVGEKRNQFYQKRKEYAKKSLWSKLKNSKGKEQQFIKDINHKISKKIIDIANKYDNCVIVMERLDDIREQINYTRKMNRRLHNWSFSQLQEFIQYKAHNNEIAYRKVPAYYTSQVCRHCMNRSIKRSPHNAVDAVCESCKKECNADFTGAVNIVRRLFSYIVEQIEPRESGSDTRTCDGKGDTAPVGKHQLVSQLSLKSLGSSYQTEAVA